MSKEQGPGNFRVEEGQPISQAFSAAGWNRAQTAADLVLGSNGGVKGRDHRPPAMRQVVTCIKFDENDFMMPGHAVIPSYGTGFTGLEVSPSIGEGELATSESDLTAQSEQYPALRSFLAAGALERNNPNPFAVSLYDSSPFNIDISPPLGFVTEVSKPGDKTVRVCVSGIALALVRCFESQTTPPSNLNGVSVVSLRYTTLVRGRKVYKDGTSTGGYEFYEAPDGVMDIGPGGSVMALSLRLEEPASYPAFSWVWVQI